MKVVKSAVANVSLDEEVNVNRLYVSDARADVGPLLNNRLRFRPGPQGRAMPFAKRLSHLTIKVREWKDEDVEPADKAKAAAKKSTKGKAGASSKKAAPKKKATKQKAAQA
jgi:large subunit ribosomal protein L22